MKGFNKLVLTLVVIAVSLWGDAEGKYIRKKKVNSSKIDARIVNGDEVTPHSMPYMAAIHASKDGKVILCGGSLIQENIVMTAARCVSGASEAEIILGAHNIDSKEDTQLQLTSTEFIIHPEYKDDSNLHDIALILLPSEVTLNDNIAVVPLPKMEDIVTDYDDTLGLVAGWGKTSDTNQTPSSVLQAINVTIIPTLTCELSYIFSLTFDQMCTTGIYQKNICFGDSGSPLLVDGVQVGIASYGSSFGCEVGLPGVYTRLTSYLSWLYINSGS